MSLLTKIRLLCNERDITLASLEKTLNFGNGSLSRWDKSSPATDKVEKVADYFNVSVDYLLGREDIKSEETDGAFFRLKKGLEPMGLDEADAEFLLTVYKAHKERNK